MARIIVVGTSHISKQSIDMVKSAIEEESPDVVAVELDRQRYAALTQKSRKPSYFESIRQIGLTGFLFALFGQWGSEKLGKITGIKPGSEMLKAIRLSRERNARVALIDQNIAITLQRLSKEIKLKHKLKFFFDIITGIFKGKKIAKELGLDRFNINSVPEDKVVANIIRYMKKHYPPLYKVLIYERNIVLAKNIFVLSQNFSKVVAVVGAGHIPGIKKMLEKNYNINDVVVWGKR